MKKTILSIVASFILVYSSLQSQSIKVIANGYVGINNSSPTSQLHVLGTVKYTISSQSVAFDGSGFYSPGSNVDLGTSLNYWWHFYSTYGYFTYAPVVTSDLNYKTNVLDLGTMTDKVKLLRPVSYQFKTDIEGLVVDKSNNNTQFGFIAQELQSVFPDMVVKQDNGVLGIRYTELISVLVKVLKEQQDEIETLSSRVDSLEKAIK
jgi:hypothetical protein